MSEGADRFERLFSQGRIRDVELRNRVATAAIGWDWAGPIGDAKPPAWLAPYWGGRAAGGVGLIVAEPQSVHATSTPGPQVIENGSDEIIDAYRPVAEAVHATGATIIAHLNHAGHLGGTAYRNTPLWAPSAVRAPMGTVFPSGGGVIPHAMSEAEIAETVEAFAEAARRMVSAGYDGIEVNAAEGYLLAQFLSPVTNRRSDSYGGHPEARRRLLVEVVAAVRERIGDALLGVRIGTDDHLEGRFGVDDVAALAAALAQTGVVDYLATTPHVPPPIGSEPGAGSDLTQAAKEASGLPVIYMGWIDTPATAESLLEAGVCDLVAMPRATLADPEWVGKVQRGKVESIRPCIACNECLIAGTACVINATAGPLYQLRAGSSDEATAKRVLVIGGGPAGVEAACRLSERGHEVVLWERKDGLGGQLPLAATAPQRERLNALTAYLEQAVDAAGVTVELGREATVDGVKAFAPEAVVVATGAGSHIPDLPGMAQPHVSDVRSVLSGDVDTGDRVMVVLARADHRYQGLSAAEFLAAQGKSVLVVTNAHFAGDQWEETNRLEAYRRLARLGVEFTAMVELVAVRENEVELRSVYSLESQTLEVDSVVLSYGDQANNALLNELEGELTVPVLGAGDVVAPGDLQAAFRDGALASLDV